jgi:GNAT superfamily N-acetyltransferase
MQLERVRQIAAALPEASERLSHGEPTFFVAGKVFVMFADNHHGDGRVAVWLPVPPGAQEALIEARPKTFFRPPYVGHRGWVGIVLHTVDDAELRLYVETAWELVAPKRLRAARKPAADHNIAAQPGADLTLSVGVPPANAALNALFGVAWPGYTERDWLPVLERSLTVVCAYRADELVGFVNVAWDGGVHAFLLDTTVHPDLRRQGLGTRLVRAAATASAARGAEWLHVDYEPHLEGFYRGCGFVATHAGLLRLDGPADAAR